MINKVELIGRLGDAPTIHDKSDRTFATMNLATTESWQNQQGEWQEKTEWHSLIWAGKYVEQRARKLAKGDLIRIEGSITYTKKDEKYFTNIKVRKVNLIIKNDKNSPRDSSRLDDPTGNQVGADVDIPGSEDLPF